MSIETLEMEVASLSTRLTMQGQELGACIEQLRKTQLLIAKAQARVELQKYGRCEYLEPGPYPRIAKCLRVPTHRDPTIGDCCGEHATRAAYATMGAMTVRALEAVLEAE